MVTLQCYLLFFSLQWGSRALDEGRVECLAGEILLIGSLCFFFFQAEDGIRDIGVTGVQTCALPIFDMRQVVAIKMATSILDYIFRELAISYLDRNDLAHVEPADLLPDTLGKGAAAESNLRETEPVTEPDRAAMAAMMQRVASNGFVRNKLTVLQGGGKRASAARGEASAHQEPDMPLFSGALAVAASVEVTASDPRLAQIQEARMKGYEGDSCEECGNFTLVRNGTCLKCDTCGGTSGCS